MPLKRIVVIGVTVVALSAPIAPGGVADCADCDGDGNVGIADLITAVGIVLGTIDVSACAAIDRDQSGSVTVAEVIGAIAQALSGCTPSSSPTSTPPEPATPTPTPTPTPTTDPATQIPPTVAPELLAWLQAGTYATWHAESAPHPGTGPHFGVVRVFLNDALFASLSGTGPEHPAGAAAVKELYGQSGSTVRGWSVMVKVADDSDAGSGWYWFETFGNFTIGGIGLNACTTCHSLGRDFVRIPFPLQ